MKRSNQKYTFIFPGNSPTELKADPFLGTKILQHVDDWIFREAERWPHPWHFLLDVRRLPPAAYDLFQAAESVSHAINRLENMLYCGATLQRDLCEEMTKQERERNRARATRLARNSSGSKYNTDFGKATGRRCLMNAPQIDLIRGKLKAERALVKRHGRKGLKPLPIPTAAEFDPIVLLEAIS